QSVFRMRVGGLAMGRIADGNSPMTGDWSSLDYRALEQAVTAMDVAADFSFQESSQFRVAADGTTGEPVSVMPSSGSYFEVLGGQSALGRTLAPADDQPGSPKRLVLNYAFWKTRLNADPAIVGRTVWLDEVPFTVVGVAARGFSGSAQPPAMWTTLSAWGDVWASQQQRWKQSATVEIESLSRLPSPTPLQRDRLDALQSELGTTLDRWSRP